MQHARTKCHAMDGLHDSFVRATCNAPLKSMLFLPGPAWQTVKALLKASSLIHQLVLQLVSSHYRPFFWQEYILQRMTFVVRTFSFIQHGTTKVALEKKMKRKRKKRKRNCIYWIHCIYVVIFYFPSFVFNEYIFTLCLKYMFYYLGKIKQLTLPAPLVFLKQQSSCSVVSFCNACKLWINKIPRQSVLFGRF